MAVDANFPSGAASTSDFSAFLTPDQAKDYFAEVEKTSILQTLARKVPMGPTGIEIPFWNGAVSASWVDEGGRKPLTKGGFDKRTLKPTKIATIFAESAEVVRANPMGYLQTMRTKIAEAIALAFDAAGLYGTNAPSAFDGYLAQTTKNASLVSANAYQGIGVNALKQLVDDGKKWTGTLFDNVVEPIFNGAVDSNGRPLFVESVYTGATSPLRGGSILSRPTYLSDHVASGTSGARTLGFMGDFSQVIWGQVGGLSFDVTDQATLDFGGLNGGVWEPNLISLWQHNMVAVRCEAEYAFLVNDPQAFVRLTDIVGSATYTLDFNGATGGSATVSLNGLGPSATIAYNAAASAVKTAIVGIDDSVLAADVTVTGSAGVYTVTVPGVLTADGASLTGGTPSATASVTLV